jgi:hypothetical protein
MKPRTTKRFYWGLTGLFALLMIADGAAGVLREESGQAVMRQLGYPLYLLSILGTAKIMGSLALIQPYFRTLKEWAYAGFAINFIGAAASWFFSGVGAAGVLPPLVALALLLGLHSLWRKYERAKAAAASHESHFSPLLTPNHATA